MSSSRHQAVWPRRRREHDPGARRRSSGPSPQLGVRRDRHRHAASRPAQRAGQRDGQALRGDPSRVPGPTPPSTRSWARATSNTIWAPRPTALPEDGKSVHLSLTANPSHLEAVNPVVMGKVRAKQRIRATPSAPGDGDPDARRCRLHRPGRRARMLRDDRNYADYRIGGTIHLIINNQIGFTTSPAYAAQLALSIGRRARRAVPGLPRQWRRPGGGDCHVAQLATEFRQKFKKDVVIDLWCYRRHGHNEGDEPAFTQPLMYRSIAAASDRPAAVRPPLEARRRYRRRRGAGDPGRLSRAAGRGARGSTQLQVQQGGLARRSVEGPAQGAGSLRAREDRCFGRAPARARPEVHDAPGNSQRPSTAEPGDRQHGGRRSRRVQGIDWATAEHLAFATLLVEGFPVRLSGEDVGRGTFSQRHAVIYDQSTEERYIPLDKLSPEQAPFEVVDSFLSEEGVLGFEYGYSALPTRTASPLGGAVR